MNFTLIKIGPSDDEDFQPKACKPSHFVKTDAFTVLPPLSPQIPGPPPTPSPYRILPPIVSRKRPSFVIIQELGSRPPSRDPSPSGRVSPFRGCGFKPSSREPSPSRNAPDEGAQTDDILHRSRSRLPVALKGPSARKMSKSVSPVGHRTSSIPRPLNRRISYSPHRSAEILSRVTDPKTRIGNRSAATPLKSSENLLNRRPAASEGDLKSALRKCATDKKPPIARKPKTTCGDVKSPTKSRTSEKKPVAATPSPTKSRPPLATRPEGARKNENSVKGALPANKVSPAKARPTARSPSKISTARSKENLSPTAKIPSPTKTQKTPAAAPKTPVKGARTPTRTPTKLNRKMKANAKVEAAAAVEGAMVVDEGTAKGSPDATAATSENPKTANTKSEKAKPLPRVGRKALTTSNLLNSLRKTNKEEQARIAEKKEEGDSKRDEKKELPHTDTSKSLPIAIGMSNMTDSSVTLIRTTTEPALAPVELGLLSEIRSAMNEAKKVEETPCVNQEVTNGVVETPPPPPLTPGVMREQEPKKTDEARTIAEEASEIRTETERMQKRESPVKVTPEARNSPRPAHVVAVAKIEEPKQEITSTVVNIKEEAADGEVLSANTSIRSGNRNGISKSSWLNEKPESEPMRKPAAVKQLKENPSTECLVQSTAKPSRWNQFKSRCPKCFRKTETQSIPISTITKGSDATKAPPAQYCFGKYLCCFCHTCRLRKRADAMTNGKKSKCKPRLRCVEFKSGFKNLFTRASCRSKKGPKNAADSETDAGGAACVSTASSTASEEGCCGRCKSRLVGCLGILCCLNSAFCLKVRAKCGTWCACCKKCCWCCGTRKKSVITEAERRKSTISVPRKRKWTRVLTDFPKLDSSFVEHGSVMRGSIPVLPVPLAWICLILNVFLPGFGTLSSGIFCLCVGKPRFSINDSILSRIGAFLVNLLVAGSQLFTVLFCLVGWGWSIWWGVIMLKMAKKNKRIIMAEQGPTVSHIAPVVGQNHDPEKGTSTG